MILCSGCFDGLHVGHVRYLRAALDAFPGHRLTVAVAPDAYIRATKARSPKWSEKDRVETVFALGMVDRVVMHGEFGAADIIHDLKPAAFIKGEDWQAGLPEDVRRACHEVGARIAFVKSGVTQHSSDAIPTLLAS